MDYFTVHHFFVPHRLVWDSWFASFDDDYFYPWGEF